MSIDTTNLGRTAAELMEAIEDAFAGVDGLKLAAVGIVVEVATEAGPEAGGWSRIVYRCSETKPYLHRALFREAVDATYQGPGPDSA